MFGLGPVELAIILAIIIVLFGARRLPELGAATGRALRNLKAGLSGDSSDSAEDSSDESSEDSSEPKD